MQVNHVSDVKKSTKISPNFESNRKKLIENFLMMVVIDQLVINFHSPSKNYLASFWGNLHTSNIYHLSTQMPEDLADKHNLKSKHVSCMVAIKRCRNNRKKSVSVLLQ